MASRHPAPRRAVVALAAVACAIAAAAFASPAPAGAATGVRYGLTDDAWLLDGPGTLDARVATLAGLGVKIVRFSLHWNTIAPTEPAEAADPADPAYDWSDAAAALDSLKAHGIDVLVQLVGTPAWANGGKPPNYVPASGSTFAAFASAAAREFPWVRRWLIWNEPNQARWLRPTSASLYVARLLNPAYVAIHDAIPSAEVAGGGTAPRGQTGGVSPVAWIGTMRRVHAKLDAYAQNPYPLDPKRETPMHGGCGHCTTITMATLPRLVTLVAKDFPHARIWLSEYGYQSNPPDKMLGVSPSLQARYLSEGDYVAYHSPRVDVLIHFLYQDEPVVARFQSGLVTTGGTPKPAYGAFELPLAQTSRSGTSTRLWGQLRAPATIGAATVLERHVGSSWRRLATIRPGAGRFFRWRGTLPRGAVVRLRSGALLGAALKIV